MTFPYSANTQTYSFSYVQPTPDPTANTVDPVTFNISITNDDFDHVYKTIYGQVGTTLTNTASVMEDVADTLVLLKANIEQIKTDMIRIQEDIAALEERGKSDRKGIVTTDAYWGSDCNDLIDECVELEGTIEVEELSIIVIGSNTTFTALAVDNIMDIGGEKYRIKSIESDTQLTLKTPVIRRYEGTYRICRDVRYRTVKLISVIENLKECGLYDDLINEINNPTEV
jgi:hypothetical protein